MSFHIPWWFLVLVGFGIGTTVWLVGFFFFAVWAGTRSKREKELELYVAEQDDFVDRLLVELEVKKRKKKSGKKS